MSTALAPLWLRQATGRGLARIARARYRAWLDAGKPGDLQDWIANHPIPGDRGWSPAQTPRLDPARQWRARLELLGAARLAGMGLSPAPALAPSEFRS